MQQKPGWKTSEFWMGLLAIAAPLMDAAIQHAPQNAIWTPLVAGIVSTAYNWSRAHAKVGVANAVANTAIAQAQAVTAQAMQPTQGLSQAASAIGPFIPTDSTAGKVLNVVEEIAADSE